MKENEFASMNQAHNIWSQFPIESQIACLVGYASIFNDVISLDEVKRRLNFNDEREIEESIDKVVLSGRITSRNGFLALPHLDYKIDEKKSDFEIANGVIKKKIKYLKWLGKLPFIKFVGISGSLAAGNPVQSKDRKLDLDVFVITNESFTWLFGILAAIYRTIGSRFKTPVICINHIWSESDLLIYNQNLYTAIEVWNLIPVYGQKCYYKFLQTNQWLEYYFPDLYQFDADKIKKTRYYRSSIVNRGFFLLFYLFRCLKKFSLASLRNFSLTFDFKSQFNLNRRGAQNGGYQLLVQTRFEKNMKLYLEPYMDQSLIDVFFTDVMSQSLSKTNFDFKKLSKEKAQLSDLALNYSKYKE